MSWTIKISKTFQLYASNFEEGRLSLQQVSIFHCTRPLYRSLLYIYIYPRDIYFLLGSTDNPNSLLSKIFLLDEGPSSRRNGEKVGYPYFSIVHVSPSLDQPLLEGVFCRAEGRGFLINGSLHWIRLDSPREIGHRIHFSKFNSEYSASNRLHLHTLRSYTPDSWSIRERERERGY